MPLTAISMTASWSRGRSRRPTTAARQSCGTTTCTISCAFCGKKKHYQDECYHKQRLSAKLKTENAGGKGGGKGNANEDNGQGKS